MTKLADADWMELAACRGKDPSLWFIESPTDRVQRRRPPPATAAAAKAICRACPVRNECLEHAINNHETHGVWGGLSPRERQELRRRNTREVALT